MKGRLIEHSANGEAAVWGTVTRWEPPEAVAFTWHPGRSAERASHVEVTFAAVGTQTLVRLEHTGWDAFDDPAAARAEYEHGLPLVLDGYQEHLSEAGETWVALLHRPGPAAPAAVAAPVHHRGGRGPVLHQGRRGLRQRPDP